MIIKIIILLTDLLLLLRCGYPWNSPTDLWEDIHNFPPVPVVEVQLSAYLSDWYNFLSICQTDITLTSGGSYIYLRRFPYGPPSILNSFGVTDVSQQASRPTSGPKCISDWRLSWPQYSPDMPQTVHLGIGEYAQGRTWFQFVTGHRTALIRSSEDGN